MERWEPPSSVRTAIKEGFRAGKEAWSELKTPVALGLVLVQLFLAVFFGGSGVLSGSITGTIALVVMRILTRERLKDLVARLDERLPVLTAASRRAKQAAQRRAVDDRRYRQVQSVAAVFLKSKQSLLFSPLLGMVLLLAIRSVAKYRYGIHADPLLSDPAFLLLLAYSLVLQLDNYLAIRRIRHGRFGDNEAEARELVAFILNNQEKFDSDDGNFRVFDARDARELTAALPQLVAGVRHA